MSTNLSNIEIPDLKPESRKILTVQVRQDNTLFTKYSTLNKLVNVIAYILRFKHNSKCQSKETRLLGRITIAEVESARLIIIKHFQQRFFNVEINDLQRFNVVTRKSKLFRLSPFLDENGLIRVGGRLKNADIPFDSKHHIVLPSKCTLTSLIIRHLHFKNLHAGPQMLLSIIRQNYWPIRGRNTVKSILRKCVICFQISPHTGTQKVGDLPAARVRPTRSFF